MTYLKFWEKQKFVSSLLCFIVYITLNSHCCMWWERKIKIKSKHLQVKLVIIKVLLLLLLLCVVSKSDVVIVWNFKWMNVYVTAENDTKWLMNNSLIAHLANTNLYANKDITQTNLWNWIESRFRISRNDEAN